MYVSARRAIWHSLLEDVVTIRANGATTAEDVAIRLNARQSLLLLTWNIDVTKGKYSFRLCSPNTNQLLPAKFSSSTKKLQ